MIHLFLVPVIVDPGLTQVAMRRLAQYSICRNGKPHLVISEENQAVTGVTANLFSYRGLCDPGDLNHLSLN